MAVHLTINGRPLCQHTACQAGEAQRRKVEKDMGLRTHCQWSRPDGGLEAMLAWAELFPWQCAALVSGPCPETVPDRSGV